MRALASEILFWQLEIDRDLRLNFHGLAVEEIRFVLPLKDGFPGRASEYGISGERFHGDNVSAFADRGLEFNCSLDMHAQSVGWVDRLNFLGQQSLRDSLRNVQGLEHWLGRVGGIAENVWKRSARTAGRNFDRAGSGQV